MCICGILDMAFSVRINFYQHAFSPSNPENHQYIIWIDTMFNFLSRRTVVIDMYKCHAAGRYSFRILACIDLIFSTAGGPFVFFGCTKHHRIFRCVTPRPDASEGEPCRLYDHLTQLVLVFFFLVLDGLERCSVFFWLVLISAERGMGVNLYGPFGKTDS